MTPRWASPSSKAMRWHGVWDRLSLYLPVALMGALAVVTYGVVQQLPPPAAPGEAPLAASQPDYRLEHFTLRRYAPDGTLETVLSGTTLEHVPAAQMLTVEQARLERLSREEGTRLYASADTLQTDDDRTRYWLQGNVRVVREPWLDPVGTGAKRNATPRLTLEGQSLTWHTQQRLLASDQPVRVTRSTARGTDVLLGNRLRYDERAGVAELDGQVRATLAARTGNDGRQ
jgi:lipopolysaccharide export system protein LptC